MWILLLLIGGAYVVNRQREGKSIIPDIAAMPTDNRPFFSSSPSTAGSRGTGQTSALGAWFDGLFAAPGPYVPLSGPGGATTDPAASGAPSGRSTSLLTPAAPGTTPDPSPIVADVASMSDPAYWWMQQAVDVAIMRDDVSGAMLAAGDQDLSASMMEASTGMVLQ